MKPYHRVIATKKNVYAFGLAFGNKANRPQARTDSRYGIAWTKTAGGWGLNLWAFWAVKIPIVLLRETVDNLRARIAATHGPSMQEKLADKGVTIRGRVVDS